PHGVEDAVLVAGADHRGGHAADGRGEDGRGRAEVRVVDRLVGRDLPGFDAREVVAVEPDDRLGVVDAAGAGGGVDVAVGPDRDAGPDAAADVARGHAEVRADGGAGGLVEADDAASDERLVALGRDAHVNLAVGDRRRGPVVVVVLGRRRHVYQAPPDGRAGGRVEGVHVAVGRGGVDGELAAAARVRYDRGGGGEA